MFKLFATKFQTQVFSNTFTSYFASPNSPRITGKSCPELEKNKSNLDFPWSCQRWNTKKGAFHNSKTNSSFAQAKKPKEQKSGYKQSSFHNKNLFLGGATNPAAHCKRGSSPLSSPSPQKSNEPATNQNPITTENITVKSTIKSDKKPAQDVNLPHQHCLRWCTIQFTS